MNVKVKTRWSCQECGTHQTKWIGQCPICKNWNSYKEETEEEKRPRFFSEETKRQKPKRLVEISLTETPRIATGVGEIDRLLGGGLVPGALTLIGGDPGIGKSTLLLQIANIFAKKGLKVLYISGEESLEQTSLRAKRLDIGPDSLFLLAETNFSYIKQEIDDLKPDLLIVDSIQIVYKPDIASAPGSVTQVRECATEFMYLAKNRALSTFLIGHVTKSGDLAGPRVLEHLVDTVLYFEGDKQQDLRLIRVQKNRFGATDEIAVFHMTSRGLSEVSNPSALLLEERRKESLGSVVVPTLEGTRPLLIEIQALVTETFFPSPSRKATGIDGNRLSLLLAVLEKKIGFPLHKWDVFVSLVGGMKVSETALDLGILLAIASSAKNIRLHPDTCIFGEVGLDGGVRSVVRVESRLKEAIHMGFKRAILPERNLRGIPSNVQEKLQLIGVKTVEEAIERGVG